MDMKTQVGNYMVSTVDLKGIDHSFGKGPPHLFETMVFVCGNDGEVNDYDDHYCGRYSTEKEAKKGHRRVVQELAMGRLELY